MNKPIDTVRPHALAKLWLLTTLWLAIQASALGQDTKPTVGFVPASVEEVDVAFPLVNKWKLSGQADLQMVTQGAETNGNPFAYVQRLVVRPWLVYNGLKHMKLWAGYSDVKKYEITEAGNPEVHEQRLTLMGTFAQALPKGSMFEQVRFEERFINQEGVHHNYPRIRVRWGVNHYLHQGSAHPWFKAPNISYYAELFLKFAPASYSTQKYDMFRESVFYSAGLTENLHFLCGIIGQLQLNSAGTHFTCYYGPILTFKYNVTRKKRETFDAVDYDKE